MLPSDHNRGARSRARADLGIRLIRDEAGLSTIEYAVLFVIIIIGSIAIWGQMGDSLATEMGAGRTTLNESLGSSVKRGGAGREHGAGSSSVGGREVGSAEASPPSGGGQPPEQGTTEGPRQKRKLRY